MSATAGTVRPGRLPGASPGARVVSVLSSRAAWLCAAATLLVALGIGSVHPPVPSATARVAYLETVIKCPSCADLSIGQSEAPIAVALRSQVSAWVGGGLSDAEIEHLVVARFGPAVLLVPEGSGAAVALWALPIASIVVAAGVLALYLWRRRLLT